MLSGAKNSFHYMLNKSYIRACAGPFLVYIYIDIAPFFNIHEDICHAQRS